MHYFVVDTNFLRIDLPQRLRSATPDEKFVLTETTILETMKGPYWRTAANNSFKALAPHFDRIVVTHARGKLMRKEIAKQKPLIFPQGMIDSVRTKGVQDLLADIGAGVGQTLCHVDSQIDAAQADLAIHQLNHVQNEQELMEAVAAIRKYFNLRKYRKLPDGEQKRRLRLGSVKSLSTIAAKAALVATGVGETIANQMSVSDCFCLRQIIGFFCLGWTGAMNGSLPAKERITNELMDLDQSVIASYCTGILSREPSVVTLRQDILAALNLTAESTA